jgi:2,3-dihydroxybenzoate decarboxylase
MMIPKLISHPPELLRQVHLGMPMKLNASSYWQTNIFETSSGNFQTPLLKFHMDTIGLDRMMFSIDYPFVS